MPSVTLFLVGTHDHWATFLAGTQSHWAAQAAAPGSLVELSGFLLVLLTTSLIIAAVERIGRR